MTFIPARECKELVIFLSFHFLNKYILLVLIFYVVQAVVKFLVLILQLLVEGFLLSADGLPQTGLQLVNQPQRASPLLFHEVHLNGLVVE